MNATMDVLDGIRNVRIRGSTKVGEIAEAQERRLKWYVMRERYTGRRAVEMEEGRPERRWLDRVKGHIENGLSGEHVNDRVTWRSIQSNNDPDKSGTKAKTMVLPLM